MTPDITNKSTKFILYSLANVNVHDKHLQKPIFNLLWFFPNSHEQKITEEGLGNEKATPSCYDQLHFVFVEGSTFLCFVIKSRYHITGDDEI